MEFYSYFWNMVIISQRPLREFWEQHPSAREALSAWCAFVRECD
jgi:mRNA interferase HigB